MKSHTHYLTMNVPGKMSFVNITRDVQAAITTSGVGRARPCQHHAHYVSVFINDDERGLHHDFGVGSAKLAFNPDPNHYHHNRTGEYNADAHLKRQIMGRR